MNGELCSVQTFDGSIRISALTFGTATASQASRTQLVDAGAWCSNMIGRNWYGANKTFDRYEGQVRVCFIHNPGSSLDMEVYADPYWVSTAESNCQDLASNAASIVWYP